MSTQNQSTQSQFSRNGNVKQAVEEQFSQVAANYTISPVHATGPELLRMLKISNVTGKERVLDAGCGAGHTALAFAPHVAEVVAVDLSDSMLEQVRHNAAARGLTNVTVRKADVEELPFESGEFDIVTSRYSAHHWPHPRRALREFQRVLQNEGDQPGQLLLADIVSYEDFALDTFVQAIELLRDPSHVRDHTISQWIVMLSACGFGTEVAYEWPVRLEFDSWLARMETPQENSTMIRRLMDLAPQEVTAALQVEEDYTFTFKGALLRCVKRA